MGAISGMFSGIEQTAADQGRLPFLGPGSYLLKVDRVGSFKSKKPPYNPFFVVDFDVLAAGEGSTNAEGSRASWLVNMIHSPALGNIKAFTLATVPDLTEEEVTEEAMEAMLGDDQPLRGLQVKCEAYNKKTASDKDFTAVTWSRAG